jgi:ABC-type sulfate transport system permease component
LLVSGVTLAGIVGCGGVSGGEAGDGGRPQGETLTVLAASSLIDAFGVLANRFEELNPGVKVRQSFESSSTLLAQIQQGAPADVFASAAEEAGHWRRFFRVTVPLAFPALVAGALTAWTQALGEFGATIIFAGNFRDVTQTIPLAIFAEFQRDLDAAVALSVLVLGFAFAVILAVRYLTARSTGNRA